MGTEYENQFFRQRNRKRRGIHDHDASEAPNRRPMIIDRRRAPCTRCGERADHWVPPMNGLDGFFLCDTTMKL